MTPRKPRAPSHLAPATRAWWAHVLGDYSLEQHHIRVLTLAAESWDRCEQAREILGREGLITRDDRGNCRPHPAISIEKDSRIAFVRCVRELDLDCDPPTSTRVSPPALRSNRRGA